MPVVTLNLVKDEHGGTTMAQSGGKSEQSKDPTEKATESSKETPIFHPSQAEGERGTGQPDAASDEEVARGGAESRPRPSQAEGER